MVIGILQMEIRLPEVQSLKEKRWIIKSLATRIRNKFNVSISEIGSQDSWQRSIFAVAHLGNQRSYVNQLLGEVLNFARRVRQIEIIDSRFEFL